MTIRITWARAAAAIVGLALAGLLFAWSGVFNIAASSGHWKITDWFLHWTMRNSVRTYAAVTAPDDAKANEGLVSAAGLFKASCASCHGAPGVRPLPVMQAATPPPPTCRSTRANGPTSRSSGSSSTASNTPACPAGPRRTATTKSAAWSPSSACSPR
ncbi:hypothetical protein [Sphingomonas sp. LR55]|uniref:hypothetical protein n=1 Tax=Sphingomonas sp. LR55 TaxID=3050231 RepID=UPI002FE089AB